MFSKIIAWFNKPFLFEAWLFEKSRYGRTREMARRVKQMQQRKIQSNGNLRRCGHA